MRPDVDEYRLHRLTCPRCGVASRAELPAGVPTGPFGPRLRAILAMRAGSYRLGKRPIQQLASDQFGLTISLGMISKLERRAAEVLGPVVGELAAQVAAAPSAHINETSWPEATERMWLWVGLTDEATVFRIADNRGADVARSSPARHDPRPRARCTPPKGDRQGVRPALRAPFYDRYTPPSTTTLNWAGMNVRILAILPGFPRFLFLRRRSRARLGCQNPRH